MVLNVESIYENIGRISEVTDSLVDPFVKTIFADPTDDGYTYHFDPEDVFDLGKYIDAPSEISNLYTLTKGVPICVDRNTNPQYVYLPRILVYDDNEYPLLSM